MSSIKRREFGQKGADDGDMQPAPGRAECPAYGCPAVAAIRPQGSSQFMCAAHATAPALHWQEITRRLAKYAELLKGCRKMAGYPGADSEDVTYANWLIDLAELLDLKIDEAVKAKVAASFTKSRTAAYWVEKAIIEKVLRGIEDHRDAEQSGVKTEINTLRDGLDGLFRAATKRAEDCATSWGAM